MGAIHTSDSERRNSTTGMLDTRLQRPLSWHVAKIIYWIERQMERRRSRLALLRLNDAQLRDIGLSRSDAYREASRHFWE